MGFLALPTELDMSTVTISFWFRVPRETMDRLHAIQLPSGGASGYSKPNTWPVLQKTLTCLSWGEQPKGTVYWNTQEEIGAWHDAYGGTAPINYGPLPTLHQTGTMPPCYLGMCVDGYIGNVYVNNDAVNNINNNEACFVVYLQTPSAPKVAGTVIYLTEWDYFWIGTVGAGYWREVQVFGDFSYTQAYPCMVGGAAAPNITADEWHHVLISWNINGTETGRGAGMLPGNTVPGTAPDVNPTDYVDSPFKMYFALDDKNYTGNDLPANWYGDKSNMNGIVTSDTIFYPQGRGAAGSYGTDAYDEPGYSVSEKPQGAYSVTLGALPANTLYVPGGTNYTDDGPRSPINSVFKIEMAELQIFTGVVLDTSVESNRRAFIDYKRDQNGNIIPDSDGNVYLRPVRPSTAESLIGRKPDILLHGSGHWKAGMNTGAEGGQFAPTGTIKKYTPDPKVLPRP